MSVQGIFPIDQWNFDTRSILAGLPPIETELLMSHRQEKVYAKGEQVFREGAYAQGIFYIIEGRVKKFKVDRAGTEKIIYIANKGEFIGYHSILTGARSPDSATAMEESRIAFIPGTDFAEALQSSPTLSLRLLKALSHEFTVLANGLTLLSNQPVRERLALQLIVLREKYKSVRQEGESVTVDISREDLASLVGTTKESVVRFLSEFKSSAILDTKGRKIIIHNVSELIRIANYR